MTMLASTQWESTQVKLPGGHVQFAGCMALRVDLPAFRLSTGQSACQHVSPSLQNALAAASVHALEYSHSSAQVEPADDAGGVVVPRGVRWTKTARLRAKGRAPAPPRWRPPGQLSACTCQDALRAVPSLST